MLHKHKYIKIVQINMSKNNVHFLCIRYGFVHIGRVGSVFLTLSVTVERFFAIVYPLKRIRRTRFLIYSSVIGTIIYNIPRFFEFKTIYCKSDDAECLGEVNETISNHGSNGSMPGEMWMVGLLTSYFKLVF